MFYQKGSVTGFTKKAKLFNSYFVKQCTVINNDSSLPSELFLKTDTYSDNILKIIQNLNSEKAHGHARISIRMLKMQTPSICKPLEIIFKSCLKNGIFPQEWKKANFVLVHKKMTNYL